MYSPDSPEIRPPAGSRIIMRGVSPQRVERNNTVSAGTGRVQTAEELLQTERRRCIALVERLQASESKLHNAALQISNHADQMRSLMARAVAAEELAASHHEKILKLAEMLKQQRRQGQREAEIEALLTQQASNAENRVQTLQEELTIEKENAQLLIEELGVAKSASTELQTRVNVTEAKLRDLESRLFLAEQRSKSAEEKEAACKATEQKLTKLVELVKADKEREKERDREREKERMQEREKIASLQAQLSSMPSLGPVAKTSESTPSIRELELQEKLKAAEARISKMADVMRIADAKVRNAELFEARARAAEESKVQLENRVKTLEEQLAEARKSVAVSLALSGNSDVGALQSKIVSHEEKIRMLVNTIRTERTTFQKQLAEAKAGNSNGHTSGESGGAPPPASNAPPPPPPPGGLKKGLNKPAAGSDLASALTSVKLRSTQTGDSSPIDPPKKVPAKLPPVGSPAANLGSIAEQALARRGNLKPAPLSPRTPNYPPLMSPPPPPLEEDLT